MTRIATTPAEFTIDRYVAAVLLRDIAGHDRQPSAFLLYFFLWWQTRGHGRSTAPLSLSELAAQTGLAKRTLQDARTLLVRRKLISVSRAGRTATATYRVLRPWA
jgi:hypothetical protein